MRELQLHWVGKEQGYSRELEWQCGELADTAVVVESIEPNQVGMKELGAREIAPGKHSEDSVDWEQEWANRSRVAAMSHEQIHWGWVQKGKSDLESDLHVVDTSNLVGVGYIVREKKHTGNCNWLEGHEEGCNFLRDVENF